MSETEQRVRGLTNRQRLADEFHRRFHSQGRRFVFWRKSWWQWVGTHYKPLDPQMLESVVIRFLEAEFRRNGEPVPNLTKTIVSDVMALLTGRCSADSEREAPFSLLAQGQTLRQHVSLANGVLDVSSEAPELVEHDPEWFSLAALPFTYDPTAACPRWAAFLEEVFEGDKERIQFIEEWMGYCCIYDYSFQYAVILAGEGANGKGVLTKVLVSLLGEDNCSHVPLEQFGKRFQLAPTVGRLLNSAPEISTIDKSAEEQLKAVTGGDRLTIDVKYGAALQTKMTARLMFSCNEVPTFFDRSGGLARRLVIIPFNRVVPEEARDPQLHEKLFAELPGIFNRSLAGLRRLRERGHFEVPALAREVTKAHMLSSNPARTFLTEEITLDTGIACLSMDLFKAYSSWFKERGYPNALYLAQPQFAQELQRVHGLKGEQRKPDRRRWYFGMRCEGCEMRTV